MTSNISLSTTVLLGSTSDEREQARLENEAYKLDFVHQMRDACFWDQTLDSNLRAKHHITVENQHQQNDILVIQVT